MSREVHVKTEKYTRAVDIGYVSFQICNSKIEKKKKC